MKDLRETDGSAILAWGEVTGHHHRVTFAGDVMTGLLPALQYFEESDGRRVLLIDRPCLLTHQEHAPIALDPAKPEQYRQGDVLLNPMGAGVWQVIRQVEYTPETIRQVVAD